MVLSALPFSFAAGITTWYVRYLLWPTSERDNCCSCDCSNTTSEVLSIVISTAYYVQGAVGMSLPMDARPEHGPTSNNALVDQSSSFWGHSSDAFAVSSGSWGQGRSEPSQSADGHSSDIQRAVSRLQQSRTAIGYRNLLSYVCSLGVDVVSASKIHPDQWKFRDAGTYSAAYEAPWTGERPRTVIVKRPKESFTRDNTDHENELQHNALSSIIQELRILAHHKLRDHPNLPHILGVLFQEERNPTGTRPCVIFEKAESSLSSYLHDHPSVGIPTDTMVSISSDVASGIVALHAYGLVHGDLKPDNILLFLQDGRLTGAVADLGSCGTTNQPVTRKQIIPGTPGYYVPEYYEDSVYHSLANQPPRDVYGLGLVVFSMLVRCKSSPFPPHSSALQHDDKRCIEFLEAKIPAQYRSHVLWETVNLCVRSSPADRPITRDVWSKLNGASMNASITYEQVQDFVAVKLLTDPENPRVNNLHNMDLSHHLFSKLLSEYTLAARGEVDIRLAITMAAMYSGVVGLALERPLDTFAKSQWLLKAIELGSMAAVHPVFLDRFTLTTVEEMGPRLLSYQHDAFLSPSIDTGLLLARLTDFASRPDVESLNILVFMGGKIPESLQLRDGGRPKPTDSKRDRLLQAFPSLDKAFEIENYLNIDLQVVDSDAYDIHFSEQVDVVQYAYSNDLEGLIAHRRHAIEPHVQELLAVAVFAGSLEVVNYLFEEYGANPNIPLPDETGDGQSSESLGLEPMDLEMMEGEYGEAAMTEEHQGSNNDEQMESSTSSAPDFQFFERQNLHLSPLDDSIVWGRRSIVRALLAHGAIASPASGSALSSYHYLARFDDGEMTRLLCESAKTNQSLMPALNSTPTEGPCAGMTAIEMCMYGRKWANVMVMLEYGADPNSGQREANLMFAAVKPIRPAPLVVLKALLDHGADPNFAALPGQPPIYWAVGTSNVVATQLLLLRGASVRPPDCRNLVEFAEEVMSELGDIEAVDEKGDPCVGGIERAREAASIVNAMVLSASKKEASWQQEVRDYAAPFPETCLGKIWLANEEDDPTMLLEMTFDEGFN